MAISFELKHSLLEYMCEKEVNEISKAPET